MFHRKKSTFYSFPSLTRHTLFLFIYHFSSFRSFKAYATLSPRAPCSSTFHHFPHVLSMSLIEDLWSLLRFDHVFSESVIRSIRESVTSSRCESSEFESCRDESAAMVLKFVAMAAILIAGIGGIAIPVAGRERGLLRTDGKVFAGAKAFAAGVILATGFVHMLKDATEALKNPCLGVVWSKFPFSGFLAMMAALLTLAVDSVATQYYERKQGNQVVSVVEDEERHIVGMHAHAANHTHSHSHDHSHSHSSLAHHHDDVERTVRHVVVSQVLELGIVSHSVIIGLSLGVSQSPCTMRPLIVALSFHQFFEGFALGGCITQAQFKTLSATIMASVFALTTPLGVAIGTSIASIFNPNSPGTLITEGILDSLSAGILVYMALVDLIAADFHSKKMRCNNGLQIMSFCLLFLGAGLMSLLAIWA